MKSKGSKPGRQSDAASIVPTGVHPVSCSGRMIFPLFGPGARKGLRARALAELVRRCEAFDDPPSGISGHREVGEGPARPCRSTIR